MKKFKKFIVLFATLALVCTGCNNSSALPPENMTEDPRPDALYFESEGDYLYYSDDYFRHRASSYNEHLATLSIHMAKYSQNKYNPSSPDDEKWFHDQPNRLKAFWSLIGFKYPDFNEDYYSRTSFDTVGIGCASRVVTQGDNKFTVIACTVRSGGYFFEWENNVFLGDGSKSDYMHEGWYNAANRLIDFVGQYIKSLRRNNLLETEQIKLWMSGFSRGGAITNLAAGLLDNKLGVDDSKTRYQIYEGVNLKREDILTYTFEAPQGANVNSQTVAAPRSDLYNNIFNIVNPNDIVPKVAMSQYGFTRFGIDKFITTEFFAPASFNANRNTAKLLYYERDKGYNWTSDDFTPYGIKWADLITDITSYTNIVGLIIKWISQGDLKPDIITLDDKKVNYDANIVLTIAMNRVLEETLPTRQLYVDNFQTFARKLMHVMMKDVEGPDDVSWQELVTVVALQGIGSIIFPGISDILELGLNLEDFTGATGAEIEYALGIAGDLFLEYPTEVISIAYNMGNIYKNHDTELNCIHAMSQDSYYIDAYNESHLDTVIKKVPYRKNSEFIHFHCLDINEGELSVDGNRKVRVDGSEYEQSTISQCDRGFAVGYYHYATYERMEWFAPACYKVHFSFYDRSWDYSHRVYVYKYCYTNNQNAMRLDRKIVDDIFVFDAGSFDGDVKADVEPEDEALTDLTNTSWKFNNPTIWFGPKYINFTSNGRTFDKIQVTIEAASALNYEIHVYYGGEVVASAQGLSVLMLEWVDDAYKTIQITGGQDAKDPNLINWLYSVATQLA